jgi:hypothetical protein
MARERSRLRDPIRASLGAGPPGGAPRWSVLPAAIAWLGIVASSAAQALAPAVSVPAARGIETSLFLIGDAGHADRPDHPVVSASRRAAGENAGRSLLLFLGDNAYPEGLPGKDTPRRAAAETRLNTQVDAARASGAPAIFIPGNHDWAHMRSDGWDQVRREAGYVVERGGPPVRFLPEGGCPGPITVDVGRSVRLVLLDTQWWLHKFVKPVGPTSTCPTDSEEEVLAALGEAVRGGAGRYVFVAGHHPLASRGPHGGYFPFVDHLFPLRHLEKWLWLPLPIIGSAYPLARQNGISEQDLSSGAYRHMRDSLESVFRGTPPLAYLAGHDHGLQVLSGGGVRHLLVSGAGSYDHDDAIGKLDSTRYASRHPGFMRVDVLEDGRVRLGVLLVDAGGQVSEAFSSWLD